MIGEAVRIKKIMDAVRALEKTAAVLKKAASDLTPESLLQFQISEGFDFYEAVRRFEIYLIERALLKTNFNQSKAARLLGIKNSTLHFKIKRYKIQRSDWLDEDDSR